MAGEIWTDPRDWVDGETPTGAMFNTHLRDNLKYLKTSPTFDGDVSMGGDLAVDSLSIVTYRETKTAPIIAGGVLLVDLALGTNFTVALTQDITVLTFSHAQPAGSAGAFTLVFTADGTPRTITWPANVKWPSGVAPIMSSGAGKSDIVSFLSYDGGISWYGFINGQNFS